MFPSGLMLSPNNQYMILALTGHRPSKLGNEYDGKGPLSSALFNMLYDLITSTRPEKVISGMALGADTIWAKAAVAAGVPFIAAIPFIGQEHMWPVSSIATYRSILTQAAEVVVVSEGGYSAHKMQLRNEWMVDHCDGLVAVWDGTRGGTANCVVYAERKHKPITRIDVLALRQLVR